VVTNHNKFDAGEFKALRKKARKQEISLLPGVELSVNDGSNGVHVLVVFSDEWVENGNDYVSPFITTMFPGKATSEYQHENGRSDKNILQLVEELEKSSKDYFLVFAHVEQASGLWNELGGGKLGDFATPRYETVRQRALGFQKVRTHDKPGSVCRAKVKDWLGGWYPAEVEGADCKSVDEIGKGKPCYLKLGAAGFDAVKFALSDAAARVATEIPQHKHSHVRSMRFTGGTLDGQELRFSTGLNTLIGIRGSGKSSVLEALRFALEIPFGDEAGDTKYKDDLVAFTLGSTGGKVEVDAVDRHGQPYTVRRVLRAACSEVLIDGKLQPGVSIRETVVHKPIYFGQKDLSNTGEGFEKDLVDKLLGSRLDDVRRRIGEQKEAVSGAVDRLQKLASVQERIDEQRELKQDTEHRLKFYTEHGIEVRLQKQLDFDADLRTAKEGIEMSNAFVEKIEAVLANHEDDLRNLQGYVSKHNQPLFEGYFQAYGKVVAFLDQIKLGAEALNDVFFELQSCDGELKTTRQGMVEEFAAIERKLAEELKNSGVRHISSDDFLKLKKRLSAATRMVTELEKQRMQRGAFQDELLDALSCLSELWMEEFQLIKAELDKVGSTGSSLSIASTYKGGKDAYVDFMQEAFRGSNIRATTFDGLAAKYDDCIAIYRDWDAAQSLFGSAPAKLAELFLSNLKTLLTYQTPNRYTIKYRGKELQHHSLGQRASALILFVLSQRENDLIIIDQPEDDLDNQTIYEDVIKLIRTMKAGVQFVLATHNPNIPVLGDAEQVHACSFADDSVMVQTGSVDDSTTQRTIVNIMEGGKEAFARRKEIYQIWKP
jgi:chromosome segregation protein